VPLSKAEEALKAAELCFENGLFDSCASRCYYSAFWAAIAALEWAGYPRQKWSHEGLANVFGKELVKKRKRIPSKVANSISQLYDLRRQADYSTIRISKQRAKWALRRAKDFVDKIQEVIRCRGTR